MNTDICIILKSHAENGESFYESAPSTWCDTKEDAAELLTKTLNRLQEWYPDLRVILHNPTSLYVCYTKEDGTACESSYWVRRIDKYDSFAW